MTSDLERLEHELASLQSALEAAQRLKTEHEASLAELEERRIETEGRVALAQRQATELASRLQTLEDEVEEGRTRAAVEAFDASVAAKDETAERIAQAIDALLASLDELDDQLRQLHGLATTLAKRGVMATVTPEPQLFVDAWQRLAAVVRQTIDDDLDDELIDAAARSLNVRAVEELPVHLQEAARRRRRRLREEARTQQP